MIGSAVPRRRARQSRLLFLLPLLCLGLPAVVGTTWITYQDARRVREIAPRLVADRNWLSAERSRSVRAVVDRASFSPDCARIASVTSFWKDVDGGGTFWAGPSEIWKSTPPARPVRFQSSSVRYLAWSPDGSRVAVAADDRLAVYLAPAGRRLWQAPVDTWECAWSPDGSRLLFAVGGRARILGAADGRPLSEWRTGYAYAHACAWLPDGNEVLLQSGQSSVTLWSLMAAVPARLTTIRTEPPDCMVLSPDGELLAVSHSDPQVWSTDADLYDARSGRRIRRLSIPEGQVGSVDAWSPDGRLLLVTMNKPDSYDEEPWIYAADTGKPRFRLSGAPGDIRTCAWRPDGRAVLGLSDRGEVWEWLLPR